MSQVNRAHQRKGQSEVMTALWRTVIKVIELIRLHQSWLDYLQTATSESHSRYCGIIANSYWKYTIFVSNFHIMDSLYSKGTWCSPTRIKTRLNNFSVRPGRSTYMKFCAHSIMIPLTPPGSWIDRPTSNNIFIRVGSKIICLWPLDMFGDYLFMCIRFARLRV